MDIRAPQPPHMKLETLHYILNHVFLPPKLPQKDDNVQPNPGDIALCFLAYDEAVQFLQYLPEHQQKQWDIVTKMLRNLLDTTLAFENADVARKIMGLRDTEVLAFHIRAQNAALMLRRNADRIIFEAFEVSPPPEEVMGAEGKLLCSYPGPAIELPLNIAQDPSFVGQLVSFLNNMDRDEIDAVTTTVRVDSSLEAMRVTTDPRHITQLLMAILHGMGQEAVVKRIAKRIADDVCGDNALNPWRRSPFWLVLRVAIQTTSESRDMYKAWMVFFQTKLLQLFLDNDFSSDLLHTARVKISRRTFKLGPSAPPLLLQVVEDVVQATKQRLEKRWSKEQQQQASSLSHNYTTNPSTIEQDIMLSLLNSRAHLSKVLRPVACVDTRATFQPKHQLRIRDCDIADIYPDGLARAVEANPYTALADFEFLVQERLSKWISERLGYISTCDILGSCLEQYISAAETYYRSNPEDQSLMILTILDLWVALDTIICSQYPLLCSYSPEIPASILEPLLIRRATSFDRAAAIEQYLRRRHSDADSTLTSIYSAEITSTTFAVRYFRQSWSLQYDKSSIERQATKQRESKRAELQKLNQKHGQYIREIAALQCDYNHWTDRWGYSQSEHSDRCSKCELQREANDMKINVHEWPLPNKPHEAEAAVFELNCPPAFALWRNLTYQILRDIGMVHIDSASTTSYALEDYSALTGWKSGTSGRIVFASLSKSFVDSHYRSDSIPTNESNVCVNNGFQFRLYDKTRKEWAYSSFNIAIRPLCTLPLPKDSIYGHLQYAVANATHSHNSTIVKQGDCSINLSIHEQLAFSGLRCGSQLQWLNIARELRTKVLTFSSDEVHTLVTQAAWQMGPLSEDASHRIWHSEILLTNFGFVLIREATELLSYIADNWMEGNTVKTIIYIISRLLASATDSQVHNMGYALLRKAREITHKWMREIMCKLQNVVDNHEAVSELQRRACEMAATCRATFDVDPGIHLSALMSSPGDIAILIECAIVIHDNTPNHLRDTFPDFQKLLHRDRRLSHFLESNLARRIHADRRGLDDAVRSIWPRYQPGSEGWRQLPGSNSHWVTTYTDPLPNQRAQRVHYNMLSAALLIDGKPLGCLPQEIVRHSAYGRIFGQKIFEVIPADMPGMDYATPFLVYNYQLFFAFHEETRSLTIRARERSGETFELIPHSLLAEDFPYFLSEDYVHWMDVDTGTIEFRPLDQLWQPSPLNWRLNFSLNGSSGMVHGVEGTERLIDIRSDKFKGIAARLHSLEHSEYLTITMNQGLVSIELPRFQLTFFLNSDDELESKNMQSMVIDCNQCTGTMIGLSTQLVLRHKDAEFGSLPRSRLVLIPHGEVHYSVPSTENHVRVHIDTGHERKLKWYKYEIDTDLGLLASHVSLTSRLFKIYLHALCSHPLPDPLTCQRGTDHALQELGAASCFSFQQLTKTDVELLHLIGQITPNRGYYPSHLRVMQTTKWSPQLPVLSQHGTFATAVSKILQYAQLLTDFPELHEEIKDESHSDSVLMARATRRCAIYYEGNTNPPIVSDRTYRSRDCSRSDSQIEALKTSMFVHTWPKGFATDYSAATIYMFDAGLIKIFQSPGTMKGPDPDMSLVYSKEWLNLNLPAKWLSIYELCRQAEKARSKFELIFSFAALAYGKDASLRKHIPILLAFATLDKSLLAASPRHPSYDLKDGFVPLREQVQEMVRSKLHGLERSPAAQLQRQGGEDPATFKHRVNTHYDDTSQRKIDGAVDRLMIQWPCANPQSPFNEVEWFQTEEIMRNITKYFASCCRNSELRTFISQVSSTLQKHGTTSPLTARIIPQMRFSPMQVNPTNDLNSSVTLDILLLNRNPPSLHFSHEFGLKATYTNPTREFGQLIDTTALTGLISQFEDNHNAAIHKRYIDRLKESQNELRGQRTVILPKGLEIPVDICTAYRKKCEDQLFDYFSTISAALAPFTPLQKTLKDAGLWPPISHRTILQLLTSTSSTTLRPTEWSESLIFFAKAFIEYQHSQRLVAFALRAETNNFFKELDNASFNYLDARKNPDWLLIQIQGNFITRPIQSQVAAEMIAPSSGKNIVTQLNMGEGKSHVIVPLVASALADSKKLVRVVVLKPLAKQMFQLLVERLSGLPNRRIFYLPFSRDVKASPEALKHIRHLFEECARVRGVLVAQPEHILSFRLMVVDQTISSEGPDLSEAARDLQATQEWLNSTARDILDESDELLHVRYQLIYTMGQQQPLDDAPGRWITVQKIFDLVRHYMKQLHKDFPEEVVLVKHHTMADEGRFLHFRLLGTPASQALVSRIAEDTLNGMLLENLPFVGFGSQPSLRSDVLNFITIKDLNRQTYRKVKHIYEATALWKGLLLLRGLLAHGILVYVLSQQRWRVDYGLDPKRSLLAVPYRAKDVPSLRSEFGHPDIIICLTCLTYYYGGLTFAQVRECFEIVSKLDNPSLEYENWVNRGGEGIPVARRHFIGVNMKDMDTFTRDVIPLFQHNKGVIDFYLARVVFPTAAKEFPTKLGTSGWDLAETKANFTTGFSGTNDDSDLLPTSITQSDLVNQLRTNAQVLEYLLRHENNRYLYTQGRNGQPCSAAELLDVLVKEPEEIRVLLDVGAQMLEMTNRQLIGHWLSLTPIQDVAAGIFFDDLDNLSVLTRDGLVEPLHASLSLQRLHQCIIYLDDAHTRGTDLKLPFHYRALVTLGPKVTKDKLVQGCMRMRNLGHGHSVVFCAPPEVDRHIRRLEKIDPSNAVQVVDVLSWAMSNTCADIEHHVPRWIQQGVYYNKRQAGYSTSSIRKKERKMEHLKTVWLQPAACDLDQMYGFKPKHSNTNMASDIPTMHNRLKMLGISKVWDEPIAEEQEREVTHDSEAEKQFQLERPPEVPAAVHKLDGEVRTFVEHGIIPVNSRTFLPLMTPLRSRSDILSPQNPWAEHLLATRDFTTTTMTGEERSVLTEYLRPVNWILSHRRKDGDTVFVVMSPYEVNALLENIRKSQSVRLHIYAPRTSQSMKSFDDLAFYCIPPFDIRATNRPSLFNDVGYQLNIWAGQLYFDKYEAYLRLCLLLGISSSEPEANSFVKSNRFIRKRGRTDEMTAVCLFDKSPLPLLKTLVGLRRKGMSFESTHMGKILQARLLQPKDF